MNNAAGSKYTETRNLDLADIAKLVRADIKAAQTDGRLPAGTKCAVRISRYSGGQSLNVSVTAFAGQIWTDEFVGSNPRVFFEGERMTEGAREALEVLKRLRGAYNYNNSDSQSDYFDVRYYGGVDFDFAVTKADRVAVAARLGVVAA